MKKAVEQDLRARIRGAGRVGQAGRMEGCAPIAPDRQIVERLVVEPDLRIGRAADVVVIVMADRARKLQPAKARRAIVRANDRHQQFAIDRLHLARDVRVDRIGKDVAAIERDARDEIFVMIFGTDGEADIAAGNRNERSVEHQPCLGQPLLRFAEIFEILDQREDRRIGRRRIVGIKRGGDRRAGKRGCRGAGVDRAFAHEIIAVPVIAFGAQIPAIAQLEVKAGRHAPRIEPLVADQAVAEHVGERECNALRRNEADRTEIGIERGDRAGEPGLRLFDLRVAPRPIGGQVELDTVAQFLIQAGEHRMPRFARIDVGKVGLIAFIDCACGKTGQRIADTRNRVGDVARRAGRLAEIGAAAGRVVGGRIIAVDTLYIVMPCIGIRNEQRSAAPVLACGHIAVEAFCSPRRSRSARWRRSR